MPNETAKFVFEEETEILRPIFPGLAKDPSLSKNKYKFKKLMSANITPLILKFKNTIM